MTDLHCHILRAVDDGPAELDESLELCRIAWDNNIERIVATPHITEVGSLDSFLSTRESRLRELTSALALNGIKVEIFAGAEVYITEELLSAGRLDRLTINGSRYILAELPDDGLRLPLLTRITSEIKKHGLTPIIAHPERYTLFQRDNGLLNALLDAGALLQVNADSLCRPGCRAVGNLARDIVRCNAASFLATDAHSVASRPNHLLDMLSAMRQDIEFDYLDALVNVNPGRVLQDKNVELDTGRRIRPRRRG